jgi:protein subunit release factor B
MKGGLNKLLPIYPHKGIRMFTLKKKDFKIQTFTSGGKGGQHQNKTSSGVRIVHEASGARGESRSERSQLTNKKLALKRLSQSPKFKMWVNSAVLELETGKTIEERVEEAMKPENLEIEVKVNGRWETAPDLSPRKELE